MKTMDFLPMAILWRKNLIGFYFRMLADGGDGLQRKLCVSLKGKSKIKKKKFWLKNLNFTRINLNFGQITSLKSQILNLKSRSVGKS